MIMPIAMVIRDIVMDRTKVSFVPTEILKGGCILFFLNISRFINFCRISIFTEYPIRKKAPPFMAGLFSIAGLRFYKIVCRY
ncbi:MAG: hypothetical protein A3A85_02415 [Deltaproteobacteria bacterium RIFCSPLOWO2_01_FULL_42_9]|nr:MAG: hypothetical protein A3A85_02415 [Deltaproteobacteria bacterium RIFCSPLOWO2_01_FULL_42_9]